MTLLNALLENETFPEAWKIAKIKIIRKVGNRDWANPSSYSPISLLPIAGKIYERIIKNRLTAYLEENSLLSQHQYGFRVNRSTVQAIEYLKNTVLSSNNTYVVAVLIEIQGAFDSLW